MDFTTGELASALFFVYCAALAVPQDGRRRSQVFLASAAGILLVVLWRVARPSAVAHDWVLPPLVLLLAYWTSGALFTSPSASAEERLLAIDRALGIRRVAAALPRLIVESLEVAYAFVYPLIPVALILHLTATEAAGADRFWGVILITDYVCFGMLPWIQTRPPRALEPRPPWRSSFRRVNLELLGHASIGVNTFPSGHAAEALAAALLVVGAPTHIVTGMFLVAGAITAGAVFGRYHFAADALAGFAVALAVWALL